MFYVVRRSKMTRSYIALIPRVMDAHHVLSDPPDLERLLPVGGINAACP